MTNNNKTDNLFNTDYLDSLDFDKYLPENVFFGFSAGLDKQNKNDILTAINNYVKDNFSTRRNSYLKITKVVEHSILPDGYFYEVHEKGFGVSFAEDILFQFSNEENNSVLLRINGKNVLIVRKLDTIETNYTATEYLTEKQKNKFIKIDQERFIKQIKKPDMERVFKDKFAFFIISSILLVSSLITFGIIQTNNALHFSIKEPVRISPVKVELPLYEMISFEPSYTERLVSVNFQNNSFMARKERLINEETREVEQFELPIIPNYREMVLILRSEAEKEQEKIKDRLLNQDLNEQVINIPAERRRPENEIIMRETEIELSPERKLEIEKFEAERQKYNEKLRAEREARIEELRKNNNKK